MKFELPVPEISVEELKTRIEEQRQPIIIDVREPHELRLAKLSDTAEVLHIPMGKFVQEMGGLEDYREKEIVILCRSGHRSEAVTHYMRQHGFKNVSNVSGGILAWSLLDPGVQPY